MAKKRGVIEYGFYKYRPQLVAAVEYLLSKGITRSGEIAKRLGVSPFTVRNIKIILKRRQQEKEEKGKEKAKVKKPKDVTDEILEILSDAISKKKMMEKAKSKRLKM